VYAYDTPRRPSVSAASTETTTVPPWPVKRRNKIRPVNRKLLPAGLPLQFVQLLQIFHLVHGSSFSLSFLIFPL